MIKGGPAARGPKLGEGGPAGCPSFLFFGAMHFCILAANNLENIMTRKLLTALILIGLTVLVLVLNSRGSVSVNLLLGQVSAMKSLIFFCFTAVGVAIGLLMK
ncbi:MAG: hypothetical protein BWY59_00130 [Verrucomicrobia bacterium ADurb.Bin345]|mgnify:CR=1 FL=1|nr:MAG: hypothetical protein BWY59_00130 [Verrucomicrobia bacterium ADurb.Bin345]